MKTLQQIKEEVAQGDNFQGWQELFETCARYDYGRLENAINETTKRYATEYGKEVQKNCASKLRSKDFLFHDDYELCDKLILSEDNLPKHR